MDEELFKKLFKGTFKKLIKNGELQIEVTNYENGLGTDKYLEVKLDGEELYSEFIC